MTRYRITMIPDTSDWPDDDRRWFAGFGIGFQQTHLDPAAALETMENATALGFAVSLEHLEDEA